MRRVAVIGAAKHLIGKGMDVVLYELGTPKTRTHPAGHHLLIGHFIWRRITAKPGIESVNGDTVRFVDGSAKRFDAMIAATGYEQAGVSVEVVDSRAVSPLDWDTIFASVDKTGRALVVNEATLVCSVASEIAATIGEKRFASLDGPVRRIGSPFVPKPSTPGLEKLAYPSTDEIVRTVMEMEMMPRKRIN